jgi:hypothetical protein
MIVAEPTLSPLPSLGELCARHLRPASHRPVLPTPPKSPVPPTLPPSKICVLPTPSESTPPQLLIPLHFNSFRTSVCMKTGGPSSISPSQLPVPQTVVVAQLAVQAPRWLVSLPPHFMTSLPPHSLRARRNPSNSNPFMGLLHDSRTPRGAEGPQKKTNCHCERKRGICCCLIRTDHGSRITGHHSLPHP